MAIVTGTMAAGTALRFAAPHIINVGARRLSLRLIQQAIKKGATTLTGKIAKQQIGRTLKGTTLKGLRTKPGRVLRGGLGKLKDAQELARIQKILGPTKLPKGSLTKNLRELAKQPWKMENMGLRGGRYLGKEKAAYAKLSKLGKLRYNLESGRINPNAVGRNLLRIHTQGEIYGAAVGGVAAGMTSIGNIKEGKKLKQQAQQSQMLLNTLTAREKLEAEQEIDSLNAEQQIDPKKAKPINTIKELDRIATEKAETADIQEENLTPKPEIPTVTDDGGRGDWLAKTANSPAAASGMFSDDERWALQQQHRAWKKNRRRK